MTNEEAKRNLIYSKRWGVKSDDEALDMAIKALEQYSEWIPVSERLPKKSGDYLCTFGGTNLTGTDHYTTELDARILFDDPEEFVGWRSQNVVAWMPLPEPYEEVQDADCD